MPLGTLALPLGSVLTGQPEVIAQTVLTATANQIRVEFPPVYRAIQLSMRATNGGADLIRTQFRLDNDSGANYQIAGLDSSGTSSWADSALANQTSIFNSSIVGGILTPQALIAKSAASVPAQYVDVMSGRSTGSDISLGHLSAQWTNTTELLTRIDVFATFFTPARLFGVGTSLTLWGYRL